MAILISINTIKTRDRPLPRCQLFPFVNSCSITLPIRRILLPPNRSEITKAVSYTHLFDHPEYRGKEYQACDLLTKYLTDNGFSVERSVGGYETSFRAEWKHGEGGPVIGILCEYDALEGLGHGCGHHMQGPSCLGAVSYTHLRTSTVSTAV